MKSFLQTFAFFLILMSCDLEKQTLLEVREYPMYEPGDLGLTRIDHEWVIKVWSPYAKKISVELFASVHSDEPLMTRAMHRIENGTWEVKVSQKAEYCCYKIKVEHPSGLVESVVDPYAKVVSLNGEKAVFALAESANPAGWEQDIRPPLSRLNDIILYELHVRDFSIDTSSGIGAKGKFLAFTERGTEFESGITTGVDHLVELGITHVHLLPVFDYRSIDEGNLAQANFNWGYDPLNYNVPEGSYASDPADPLSRIREFKLLVMHLHRAGIRVVMDVVYNHTGASTDSNFNQLVPDYYYRQSEDGTFSNASACGNETASERYMMRKFMLESLQYWVREYHIDGFRFDLMGIHDIETMNTIAAKLKEMDSTICLYGEGWTAGPSPLPDSLKASKANTHLMKDIAAFSDDIRDGIKGSVFEYNQTGFASGNSDAKESVKFGIVGAVDHPQVDYGQVNYSRMPWANEPGQSINYVSCHDNHTLWDKLLISREDASEHQRIEMHKLANTIVLTSQGIPFLHAGVEFLRTKNGDHNSYESPDAINSIKWDRKAQFADVFEYYKSLIRLRKQHPAFRMTSADEIRKKLLFHESEHPHLLGYWLNEHANSDPWNKIGVFFNGGEDPVVVELPEQNWVVVVEHGQAKQNRRVLDNQIVIAPYSASIIHN